MMNEISVSRIETGVRNLDAVLDGGLPTGSVCVVAGSPGAGKTIFAQQFCFHNASATHRVLYFNTLSEPTAKTLRYLQRFAYFDREKLERAIEFVDLGVLLRSKGLEEASALVMNHIERIKPSIVVIDSFKVFDDLAGSKEALRKFEYELAVWLMAWETTAFLLGEYGPGDIASNPLFSIVDALLLFSQRRQANEQQRFIQVVKLRGTDHSRDEYPFEITQQGIEVFAPKLTMRREAEGIAASTTASRCKTGITKLDELLGDGIPRGSSVLVSGVAGTGKTVLLLEFIYRGALAGENGILFSFEETEERLRAASRGLGWDLDKEIAEGRIEIVFIAQPDIAVERHLQMMQARILSMRAKRVAIDSVSVFLQNVEDLHMGQEKVYQIATLVQSSQAVGFFAVDVPYGASQVSRFGVEETVVDGIIILTATEEGMDRQRYLEVYKLRNVAHLTGRHRMTIGDGGISVFPRYALLTAGIRTQG